MVISTRRSRTPATAAAAAAAARRQSAVSSVSSAARGSGPAAAARASNDTLGQQQRGVVDEEMPAGTGTSTSTSSSETTQTPPVSSSTGGSVDVDAFVRCSGSNKRLKVARSAPRGGETASSSAQQQEQDTGTGAGEDEDMRDGGRSGSNEGDSTSQAAGEERTTALCMCEWMEDVDTQQEILLRIADLSSKNQKLNADIELLKRTFALRQTETNRLLVGMAALNKVETDLALLQREYRDCARSNVALIQDALRRISYCSSQVDTLTSGRNVTASQLQNFRHECSREMDDLLLKLEDVEAGQQSQQDQVDSNHLSTLGEIRRNRYEIEQLKQEISACRRFMSGSSGSGGGGEASVPLGDGTQQHASGATTKAEPGAVGTGADSDLLPRIDHFSSQLEDLHNEMAMLKQFLLQESNASRSGIEKLLSRQMNDFQEVQDDETKQLQDEMDELRSELCDVLKEIHLLKERTRYLRPDCSLKTRKRSREESSKNRGQLQQQAGNRYVAAGDGSLEMCSTCSSFLGGGGHSSIRSTHCSRAPSDHPHHCRYHYPSSATDAGRVDRGGEYAYPSNLNTSPNDRSHSSPSSRSSSPRRPSDVVIQALQQQHADGAAQENQSCPSPHFSSRSSSISGRISVNRDEHGEPLPEEEVERRLLEQHRLFWIKEGAGEAK